MSSYLDAIPPAVATIVASVAPRLATGNLEADRAGVQRLVVDLTDQLTRTFAKALGDAVKAP